MWARLDGTDHSFCSTFPCRVAHKSVSSLFLGENHSRTWPKLHNEKTRSPVCPFIREERILSKEKKRKKKGSDYASMDWFLFVLQPIFFQAVRTGHVHMEPKVTTTHSTDYCLCFSYFFQPPKTGHVHMEPISTNNKKTEKFKWFFWSAKDNFLKKKQKPTIVSVNWWEVRTYKVVSWNKLRQNI
jgi:hypothetical protein